MNKTIRNIAVLATVAIALGQADVARAADANPPERMTYQGYLVDGNGAALGKDVPANYDVVFRIYDAKSGGNKLWSEQQTVTVDEGYFSVLLGEGVKFSNEIHGNLSVAFDGADASDRFIGITVSGLGGGDTEIAPRLRLVTSPYAYTATQARRLTDGSGNANFFKDGASLKLGAGSTPTLTLPEAGGASLSGGLTVNLAGWGDGLTINANGQQTRFRAENEFWFSAFTDANKFYFNKPVAVVGSILSYQQDTVLGPSNNTDTYLKIFSGSDDIHAYADNFYFKGATELKVEIEAGSVDFRTTAPSFYMNKPLEVNGPLTATGFGNISVNKPDNEEAVLSLYGPSQGTGRLFVGQSLSYGGGIVYNGDGTPAFDGGSTDRISFYRTANGVNHEVFNYPYGSNDVSFNGAVTASAMTASTITGTGNHMYLKGSAPTLIMQDSNNKDYYLHTNDDRLYVLRGEGVNANWDSTRAMTIYQGNKVGINQSTPVDELHIVHAANGNYSKGLRIQRTGGQYWAIGTDYAGDLVFGYNQGDSGTYKGYVSRGGGTWQSTSDRRLKKDIKGSEDVLSKVYQLKPVRYRFNEQDDDARKSFGLIAQDVQKLFPYLVEDEKDYLALDYGNFGVLSIKAIQELGREKDAEVASLEKKNKQLESRVQSLESELALLKAQLANSTTQEDRIAKLEELVSKIGQGE
ncbi:tail fiber domain-containing protein [bacterium]|nr:tail fiber domain-containing protein [bacterium]